MSSDETHYRGLPDEMADLLRQAASSANVANFDMGPTRLRRLKRLALRLARPLAHRQTAHNEAVVAILERAARLDPRVDQIDDRNRIYETQFEQLYAALDGWISDRFENLEKRLELAENREADHRILQAMVASQEIISQELADRVSELERLEIHVREAVTKIERARDEDRARIARHGAVVDRLLREVGERLQRGTDEPVSSEIVTEELAQFAAEFYGDFEAIYRGSPEEIQRRLEVYLPDVAGLRGGEPSVVDLGCGRGEWLDLLRSQGVPAYGIDTNKHFVASAVERGLDMRHEEALAHLASLADASVGAVTGFHLIEHVPFDAAVALADESLRVLRPGGVLILETPNPTNLGVGAASFYLDPTHLRPVHPDLLQFLLESRGYADVELRFLHPVREVPLSIEGLKGIDTEALQWLLDIVNQALFGPQDYAAVARK